MYYIEDTNVIQNAATDDDLFGAAKPGSYRAQLEELRLELKGRGFQHAISPVLLLELVTALAKSSDEGSHFERQINFLKAQNRFRILYPWDRPIPTMLASPRAFALKTALRLDTPSTASLPSAAALNEGNFNRWAEIALCAQSPEELWATGVRVSGQDTRLHTIDRASVIDRYDKEQKLHRELMKAIKNGRTRAMTRDEFARSILKAEGFLPTPTDVPALSVAVDAAYRHHLWLLNKATQGYNFEKHTGDPLDYAFLLYLADPNMCFVTHDSRIKDRIGDCPQREQIIVLPNLGRSAAAKS
jgi:hypothetical protein